MALTLAEASKLSNDVLLSGVIETIIQESPVLQALPFIEIVGNGLTYNQENVAAAASFYDVGDAWDESTPTFTQQTATPTSTTSSSQRAATCRTWRPPSSNSRRRRSSKRSTTRSSTAT